MGGPRRPWVGQVVVVRAAPALNGGLPEAPAVITRVGDEQDGAWTVNVRVLLDGSDAVPAKTGVRLYCDRAAADAARPVPTDTHIAWWPRS